MTTTMTTTREDLRRILTVVTPCDLSASEADGLVRILRPVAKRVFARDVAKRVGTAAKNNAAVSGEAVGDLTITRGAPPFELDTSLPLAEQLVRVAAYAKEIDAKMSDLKAAVQRLDGRIDQTQVAASKATEQLLAHLRDEIKSLEQRIDW